MSLLVSFHILQKLLHPSLNWVNIFRKRTFTISIFFNLSTCVYRHRQPVFFSNVSVFFFVFFKIAERFINPRKKGFRKQHYKIFQGMKNNKSYIRAYVPAFNVTHPFYFRSIDYYRCSIHKKSFFQNELLFRCGL